MVPLGFDYGRPAPVSLISFLFTLSESTDGVLATRVGWFTEYAFVFLGNLRRGFFFGMNRGLCFDWTNAIMYRTSGLLLSLSLSLSLPSPSFAHCYTSYPPCQQPACTFCHLAFSYPGRNPCGSNIYIAIIDLAKYCIHFTSMFLKGI